MTAFIYTGLKMNDKFALRIFCPYEDETMSMKHDEGNYLILNEDKMSDIHEGVLSEFIDRVILSAAMQECGMENFGIADAFDGQLVHPDEITSPNDDPKTWKSRPKRTERRGRKGKKIGKNEYKNNRIRADVVSDQSVIHLQEPSMTFPITEFRDMVNAEIKKKTRRIQRFYTVQRCQQQDETIQFYKDLYLLIDQAQKMQQEYDECRSELLRFKTACADLSEEMHAVRMAKRNRRNAAKQKRNQQQAKKSVSSSNAEMSLINGHSQSADDIETSGER